MIHFSDRETAVLIDALDIAADAMDVTHEDAAAAAIRGVLAKITARMTPATFGLYVATEGEIAIGDQLQSAASRLAEHALAAAETVVGIPYGVHEAALEARSASAQWTEVRRG